MELVSSRDVLDFLSKSAPRPWVKRLLFALIFAGEIIPYSTSGKSTAQAMVLGELLDTVEKDKSDRDARALLDENFPPETAAKLKAAKNEEYVSEVAYEWDETLDPETIDVGYFLYAERIDWEAGALDVEIGPFGTFDRDFIDTMSSLLSSTFRRPTFHISFSGISFDREAIEMLQPGVPFVLGGDAKAVVTKSGRPRYWDWDGALIHLLGIAQTPDGLPTGPGAQADIERLMSDWFLSTSGNSPAESEIRKHVSKVIGALRKKA